MTQGTMEYASELMNIPDARELTTGVWEILEAVPAVREELEDAAVPVNVKHMVIDRIFPAGIRNFLKTLCDNNDFGSFGDIRREFNEMLKSPRQTDMSAELVYVTPPTDRQLAQIRDFLGREFHNPDMEIEMQQDDSLKSGFIIRVGSREFDWSEAGRIRQLEERLSRAVSTSHTYSEDGIISILRSTIEEFELTAADREIGVAKWVGDGIVIIDGIDHANYGEIVIFDCGVKGMVQDVRRDEIGVVLFGRDTEIHEGSRVVRTGRMAGIPVGEEFLGRVVDALGAPLDGGPEIETENYRPVEMPAPGIVDRKSVAVPMETGILSIDSMFPIGRGQRELIIGDRQTGKTSIAMDTIMNQRGKDTICIYVAIGQKASTIAKQVANLKNAGAMDYTIVVSATASDPAPLQFIAPYSGTALAEYFMYNGKDVLIVYDDLSKHAVAYRAISLLLERSPGREAYPGDVFYLHSRLLERSSRLSPEAGGGSITALPIIETQAGDVSAYIPTNVISITDGQIYLESQLFFSGQRPAVNVGLSVSRVGGAAQRKAMKRAAGSVRIDLAQYREMEVFTQFSSDLDDATKKQLDHGRSLMELLKQPLGHPFSMPEQVIILVTANDYLFSDIPVDEVLPFRAAMLKHFHEEHSDMITELETYMDLSEDFRERIESAALCFKGQYLKEKKDA